MRKYGRRGSKHNIEPDIVHEANAQTNTTSHTRKRQKIAVEIVQPLNRKRSSAKATINLSSSNAMSDSVENDRSSPSLFSLGERTDVGCSGSPQDSMRPVLSPESTRHATPVGSTPHPTSGTPQKPRQNLDSYTSAIIPQPTPSPAHVGAVEETDSRTSTPRKPAKLLSQLFDIPPSPGSLAKNDGVVRRMLTRSRTESSVGGESAGGSRHSSSSSLLRLEANFQRADPGPASKPSTPSANETFDFASSSPPTPTKHAHVAPTRTYGGKSRSFLMTLPINDPEKLHEDVEEEFETRVSYTDLCARWGVDNSEDYLRIPSPTNSSPDRNGKRKAHKTTIPPSAPVLPNGMMNDLKSITELRSKGESRRFLDEVGYLFEGLDPKCGIGLRRASALQIVTKLCDADFARKAKAADFLGRSWVVLREAGAGAGDKILDLILVFFAALVARDSKSLADLAHKTDLVDTLFSMLRLASLEKDWLGPISSSTELKGFGSLNKSEKALLVGLYNIISTKAGLFSAPIIISIRLLASQALVGLGPKLIHPQYLPALQCSLNRELSLIPPRVTAYMAGLSLFPPLSSNSHADRPSFEHLENCLRLMDSFLSGQWSGPDLPFDQLEADGKAFVDGLVALCIAANVVAGDHECGSKQTTDKCLELTFRVLVSLTHENQGWCETLAHHDFALPLIMRSLRSRDHRSATPNEHTMQSENGSDVQASELDRICLALGLLTNMIQVNDKAKDLSQEMRINPTCPAKRNCLKGCRCTHRIGGLEYLASIYVQQDAATGNTVDPGADFLRGHLAVLFGLLMQQSDRHQDALLNALPGESNHVKLDSLVNQALEFVTFYAELTAQLVKLGTGEGSSRRVGRIITEGRGGDVVRDVVSFLEQLRDRS